MKTSVPVRDRVSASELKYVVRVSEGSGGAGYTRLFRSKRAAAAYARRACVEGFVGGSADVWRVDGEYAELRWVNDEGRVYRIN